MLGRTLTVLVVAATVTVALAAAPPPVHATPAVPRLGHSGAFLTDQTGRVVILHGINAVWKRPPYVAPDSAAGFTAQDADVLVAHGVNAVRLGVLFAGVMPTEGKIDQAYLTGIDRIVQLLASRRIWVLLDFHQDAFNEKFKGEGFPAWAVHDDGLPFVDTGSFFGNYQTPAVQRNYDHFWNNDFHLVDRYIQAWTAVAQKWADQPYLMGYDLFNEPSAGTQTATCAQPAGCPLFDAKMQQVFDRIRAAIRTVDPHNMVWYEQQFFSNAISATHFTHVDDPAVGLSWHDYACTPAFVPGGVIPGNPDCAINEPRVMDNAGNVTSAMGAGSLLSEFGAIDDIVDLTRMTAFADQHLVGWTYWAYKLWNDPTGGKNEGLYGDDTNPATIKTAKVAALYHPYPQAVAGVPTALSWDPNGKVLSFTYTPRRSAGLTDVFVPAATYAASYVTFVTGGRVTSSQQAGHTLIDATPGVGSVHVEVRAAAAGAPTVVDDTTRPGGATPASGNLPATGAPNGLPAAGIVLAMLAALGVAARRRMT